MLTEPLELIFAINEELILGCGNVHYSGVKTLTLNCPHCGSENVHDVRTRDLAGRCQSCGEEYALPSREEVEAALLDQCNNQKSRSNKSTRVLLFVVIAVAITLSVIFYQKSGKVAPIKQSEGIKQSEVRDITVEENSNELQRYFRCINEARWSKSDIEKPRDPWAVSKKEPVLSVKDACAKLPILLLDKISPPELIREDLSKLLSTITSAIPIAIKYDAIDRNNRSNFMKSSGSSQKLEPVPETASSIFSHVADAALIFTKKYQNHMHPSLMAEFSKSFLGTPSNHFEVSGRCISVLSVMHDLGSESFLHENSVEQLYKDLEMEVKSKIKKHAVTEVCHEGEIPEDLRKSMLRLGELLNLKDWKVKYYVGDGEKWYSENKESKWLWGHTKVSIDLSRIVREKWQTAPDKSAYLKVTFDAHPELPKGSELDKARMLKELSFDDSNIRCVLNKESDNLIVDRGGAPTIHSVKKYAIRDFQVADDMERKIINLERDKLLELMQDKLGYSKSIDDYTTFEVDRKTVFASDDIFTCYLKYKCEPTVTWRERRSPTALLDQKDREAISIILNNSSVLSDYLKWSGTKQADRIIKMESDRAQKINDSQSRTKRLDDLLGQ